MARTTTLKTCSKRKGYVQSSHIRGLLQEAHVPAIIRNILLQEHPYHSLLALQKIIGEPRFQTARLNSVNEPIFN